MGIKRILVTGCCGYIGSTLMPMLTSYGFDPTGMDTLYFKNSCLFSKFNFQVIKMDIRKIQEKDLVGYDAIIHLAALSNDATGSLNSKLTEEINLAGTVNLAKKAKRANVKRFIFSSSCSIYGVANNGIVSEKSKPAPATAYAVNKIKAEEFLKTFGDKNFCVGIMRNSTVYGASPCFRDDLVVNNLVLNAIFTGQIKILSDGTPWRPLIDVRDLSKIFIEFLKVRRERINGKIFNIGFQENNIQILQVARLIHRYLPKNKVIITGEHGPDTRSYRVNFEKFKKTFPQFKQEWPLEKSIKDLIKFVAENKITKKDFLSGRFTRMKSIENHLANDRLTKLLYWK